jgi:hypothetical protein
MRYLLFLLCILCAPAHAQVFKCTMNGQTVFMDRPCHADAQPEAVRPAAGHYDPQAGAEARERAERDRAALAQREAERAQQAAEQARQQKLTELQPKPLSRCDQLLKDHADAIEWAGKFHHPDNIAREQAKAKHAAERSFFECSPDKRVSRIQ